MKSKAAQKLIAFRDSFDPNLTQAAVGARYGVHKQQISRLEKGSREAGNALIRAMAADQLVAAADWFEPESEAPPLCNVCERRVEDPVCKSCVHQSCPRHLWPEQNEATRRNERQAA